MSVARVVLISLVATAACSSSKSKVKAAAEVAEQPWSHAYAGASDGWWRGWGESLGGQLPYGPGTQFEVETLGPEGMRSTEVIEVVSIEPRPGNELLLRLRSSATSSEYSTRIPLRLAYAGGSITSRAEHLVPVTVPAGTFKAGRLWMSEKDGTITYERDEWVTPDLPMPVQSWSRPVSAKALYDPPADGTVPEGTTLRRLVRVDRR